jgi:nucleoside-diphosphate-sugar epimerase
MVLWLKPAVFVTGGSGFVGGAVIESLARDHTVRAMARSDAGAATVAKLGASPVMCSLDNVGPEDIDGCHTVVHCAAETKEWAPPGVYESTNTAGTVRLLAAARNAGVGRFVHLSTDSVLCTGGPLRAVDESFPVPAKSPFEYAATKAAGERAVIAANDPPSFETVALRPCLVWGLGDTTIVPEIRAMVE